MNTSIKLFKKLTTLLILGASFSNAAESNFENTAKILTANFESRQVVKVEAGDFHFVPGQAAPIHTHTAPAVGYVAKGQIIYQVEGEKPQLLNEGDAFYEPAGPRILRFDNASATEEAIFIDFNLQQEGEPFIVFEKELTEKIDRRTLPTVDLKDQKIKQVTTFVTELEASGKKNLKTNKPLLGYVAEGTVIVKVQGKASRRYIAGTTFSLAKGQSETYIKNESSEVPAKVVQFYLK